MTNTRSISYYMDGRQLEWWTSISLFLTGSAMILFPKMIDNSISQVLIQNLGGVITALLFVTVGLFGMAALIANGSSLKLGPHIRSITAIVRMAIWFSFVIAMIRISIIQGFPSPMVFFFGTLTLVEAYTPYRAVLDVRSDS
jgi:hypothetical protein